MKSEYKRDLNHNYLILTGEDVIDTDSYQVRMIVANVVPDLLQCRIQGMDGKFMVYYDVTSRHSITALFEDKKLGIEELQVILGGFIQIMEEISEYLLNPCQLILQPEYIYMDAEKECSFLLSSGISWRDTETVSESCGVFSAKAGS